MTKCSKVLFLLAFGAAVAAVDYAYAKTCFIVGNCGGSVTAKEQISETRDCMKLGYKYTKENCSVDSGKHLFKGGVCGDYHEKCVCNPEYYTFRVDNNNGLYHSDNKKYVISENCTFDTSIYHTKVCNEKYKYTSGMNNSISASGNSCQVNTTDTKKYDAYTCPAGKSKAGDLIGGFNVTRGNNTSTDPRYTAVCYEARNCASINASYHEQAPASTSGWKIDTQFNAQKVGKKGSTIYNTTQTAVCYTWKKKECSDWTVNSTTLTSNSSCSEGYKSKDETVKLGDENKTCYRCIAKGCGDYSEGGVTLQSSCGTGYDSIASYSKKLGASSSTCHKCVKSCPDGYKSSRKPGYRVTSVNKDGATCYALCEKGDYVYKGGYCAANTSDVTTDIGNSLGITGKLLGIATKVEKTSGTSSKITMRIVANTTKANDQYAKDIDTAWKLVSDTYHAFDGDTSKWYLMNNDDVDAILDDTTLSNKFKDKFKNDRANLFAVLLDETDSSNAKKCRGNSKTEAGNHGEYAYADVYQCYWVKHSGGAERAVMRTKDADGKQAFSGIAATSNKFPRYSYGTHIYMRANKGYKTGANDRAYKEYLWYSISANQERIDICATSKAAAAKYQKQDANYSKITLEEILYGRSNVSASECSYRYIPLSYGVRYYEETSSGLKQKPTNGAIPGTKWPTGVQPWRIAVMYGGECSDTESKAGACRGSGSNFYCRMRMYWHGTGYICPYEMYKNGSKEPTERCFSESLTGKSKFYYLAANRDTEWNYTGRATYNTYNYEGDYKKDNTTTKYYETGVQGCFVKPAMTMTIEDNTIENNTQNAVTGNFKIDTSDYFTKLGDYNTKATEANAYDNYLAGQIDIASAAYNQTDEEKDEEAENDLKAVATPLNTLMTNKALVRPIQFDYKTTVENPVGGPVGKY